MTVNNPTDQGRRDVLKSALSIGGLTGTGAGALLGATQIIPGPIGWIGLASQVAYDVSGSKNNIPWNRQVGESIGDEMDNGGLGQALIDLGFALP